MRDVVAAFEAECRALGAVLEGLDAAQLTLPTNCPPWDLKDLVVHIWGSACRPPKFLTDATGPVTDAAGYYRRDERSTDAYRGRNVTQTQNAARRFTSGADAIAQFVGAWPGAAAAYRDADGTFVETNGLVLTVEDFLRTRVMAVAAHAVDVAITLARPPSTTPGAAAETRAVLVALMGVEPPAALGWTDVDILVAGTGRRPLRDDEIALLGDAAAKFPLLS